MENWSVIMANALSRVYVWARSLVRPCILGSSNLYISIIPTRISEDYFGHAIRPLEYCSCSTAGAATVRQCFFSRRPKLPEE